MNKRIQKLEKAIYSERRKYRIRDIRKTFEEYRKPWWKRILEAQRKWY
jgi:hypothetical protein